MLVLLSISSATFAQDTGTFENPWHIELAEWPGEFCADALGASAESGEMLQAHHCSSSPSGGIYPDQKFTTDYPLTGNIYVTEADLCVTAPRVTAGGRLILTECDAMDRRQLWVSTEDGQIHPARDPDLCWAVEARPPASPGSHKRTLTLETCSDVNSRYTVWWIPGGSVGS